MLRLKKFIANGLVLTLTSLLLRWISVLFNTYISNNLGSEGMGVYTLVQNVFSFAVTFACSGINLGATRIISENIANNDYIGIKKSLKVCVFYSLFFSFTALIATYSLSEYLGNVILGDVRTVKSIKVLALSLPFISLSSVFNGYFSAVRKVYKSAGGMIFEKCIQIGITVKIMSLFSIKGIEFACVAVAIGTLLSEILSLLYNVANYIFDFKKLPLSKEQINGNSGKKLLKISLPLAISAYARSGLVTLEHLLIPIGLRRNGKSYTASMSLYGLVQGMVFPIIMFPSCIIYSFSGLLVPELAEYNELGNKKQINKTVSTVLKYTLIFSLGVSGILMCYSYELSMVFYRSAEAFEYIKLFSPLVVVMYLDGAVDAILKGLNEQLHSMKINIADALLSVFFVYTLVPLWGIKGYITAIFICEIFNCSMSLIRLVKICTPQFSLLEILFKPLCYIIVSTIANVFVFDLLNITRFAQPTNLAIRITFTAILYMYLCKKPSKKQES